MSQMLIDYYKSIEDGSRRMLEAARAKDLEGVMRYEGVCAVLIEQLRQRAREEDLRPEDRREKTQIMQRILRNDAEIRQLTEPWLGELEDEMMGGLFDKSHPKVLH
ncbi:flagellar export protein FliJ [Hylemonella gracilis str. Niagara R]|uniref:Flagellar protein FliT n=1 Tax=Hylemonella gracilis str. Niagara R TaxID=1458275 RepID=A0A016XCU5_9BURK|nr:flagellar protein FliT [Hylemonella gracilis]EYC49631.1 flagellar export protein FliJ [Hylemonella gracilis str. Niagara R]